VQGPESKSQYNQKEKTKGKGFEYTFLQTKQVNIYKHMKKCSTLLVYGRKQIRTTMRSYNLTAIRTTIVKPETKPESSKCW
jgi:hypothetical protein